MVNDEKFDKMWSKIGDWDFEKTKKKIFEDKREKYDLQIRHDFIELTTGINTHWSRATDMLCEYILDFNYIYTTQNDNKPEMWIYREGVYIPEGKSHVMIILRELLKDRYNGIVLNKVLEKLQPDTFIDADKFFLQKNKWEIPLENGILNIKDLKLIPFDPKKIFFNKMPVKYVEGETCPKIEEFLKNVLSKEEDINVFYEMVGFCLIKEYTYEKAFMLVGDGRNGKSKSIELIKRLVGVTNCCNIPLTSLIPESFSISELHNKMVNLAGDISNKDLKDTSMFKSATGRDLLGGKRKFLKDVSFENYAKFIFACNELPMVYDSTRGFWDRWILLEFPYTFVSKDELDSNKDNKLLKVRDSNIIPKITKKEEMSGFLNMSLLGLHRLIKRDKFSSTIGSEGIKDLWIKKSNSFFAFCEEFIEDDYEGKIRKRDLRKFYVKYCKDHKITVKSDVVVKRFLQEFLGASEERIEILGTREFYWVGIKLKKEMIYT